jgi:hypothetical protein
LTDASDFWTCGEIRNLILNRFQITYSKRQVQRLLRFMNMYCYNRSVEPSSAQRLSSASRPQTKLSERLKAVADVLGMGTKNLENMSIGFADESTFQTYGNSARLWSYSKGLIRKEEYQPN